MRIERRRASHASSADKDKNDKIPVVRPLASTNKTRHRGPRSTSSKHRGVTQHRSEDQTVCHTWSWHADCVANFHMNCDPMVFEAVKCRGGRLQLVYPAQPQHNLSAQFQTAVLHQTCANVYRRTKKWEAHIWSERKQMYLGGHATEEGAARAHDIMALKCRGTESTLNYARHDYTFLGDKFDSLSKVKTAS